jgi:hypothetical protein
LAPLDLAEAGRFRRRCVLGIESEGNQRKGSNMAMTGFWEQGWRAGTINTDATFSSQQNFSGPVNTWSKAMPQTIDGGEVDCWVSKFKVQGEPSPHTGTFHPGVVVNKCTSVTFGIYTNDSVPWVALTSEFFE